MNLEQRLKEIRERCDATTEGPWVHHQAYYVCTKNKLPNKDGEPLQHEITGAYGKCEELFARRPPAKESDDHKFIAHARTDIPMLLEMVEFYIGNSDDTTNEIARAYFEKIAEKHHE